MKEEKAAGEEESSANTAAGRIEELRLGLETAAKVLAEDLGHLLAIGRLDLNLASDQL